MIKIAPSLLSADFSQLGVQIKELEDSGADMLHIDVMDGMFVPNISFGIPIIKSIRKLTKLPFDVHLMIEEPSRYIKDFADAGADIITIHYESDNHLDRTINYIKSFGIKSSVAVNPATSLSNLKYLINDLDMVLIMSVNPGFGGQSFIHYIYDKIKELRSLADKYNPSLLIEVDGGVDASNINKVAQYGADIIVSGSAVFKGNQIKLNLKNLREGI
ncbi:MAG: ribulose-phosphate 3-epimerase [Bacillota bacterium]|nr:ribulose-phosphate 3-epimerase [Bacillota bacterium]